MMQGNVGGNFCPTGELIEYKEVHTITWESIGCRRREHLCPLDLKGELEVLSDWYLHFKFWPDPGSARP